jgi:hypothetical protein
MSSVRCAADRSQEPGEDGVRHDGAEVWIGFEQALDIEQIPAALAGVPRRVGRRPDFALEYVFDGRYGEGHAEHVADTRPLDECGIARVGLDLDAQGGAWFGDVQGVWDALDDEGDAEYRLDLCELIDGDDHVEVEADEWLDVGVDRLTADEAIARVALGEERDETIQEVNPVVHDGLSESLRAHADLSRVTGSLVSVADEQADGLGIAPDAAQRGEAARDFAVEPGAGAGGEGGVGGERGNEGGGVADD